MTSNHYSTWQSTIDAMPKPLCEKHPRGDIRIDTGDHFVVRFNLSHGPLPIELTREDALALSDAIRQLHNRTALPRQED